MKAKNFRIGNVVNINGKDILMDNGCFGATTLQPVLLKQDWLTKLGVRHNGYSRYWLPMPNIKAELHFEIYGADIVPTIKNDFGELILNEIRYVHELQNLFFALTGLEFEIKELA
tara:strand:+ start:280 stop:624 length:345 start_codon:yes stop_codon:yes gene_type:complete